MEYFNKIRKVEARVGLSELAQEVEHSLESAIDGLKLIMPQIKAKGGDISSTGLDLGMLQKILKNVALLS